MRKFCFILLASLLPAYSQAAMPVTCNVYDHYPWAATYYYGVTSSDALARIFAGSFHRWPEHIQSIEFSRTLAVDNKLRQIFQPLLSNAQFAINFTQRNDKNHHLIYEVDPYLAARWENFPWNNFVITTFAIGEGISYVTSVPSLEKKANQDTKRLLNYLMLEATFASPQYPRWQLVARIHHRSGAFGLYQAGNTGSNNVGLGIRYLFE